MNVYIKHNFFFSQTTTSRRWQSHIFMYNITPDAKGKACRIALGLVRTRCSSSQESQQLPQHFGLFPMTDDI